MLLMAVRGPEKASPPQLQVGAPQVQVEAVTVGQAGLEAGSSQAQVVPGDLVPKVNGQHSSAFKKGVAAKIKERRAHKKQASPGARNGGDYDQKTALLLAILLGAFGAHRFYLGYYGIGVAQLLTGGGCGVWVLIDQIRIVTGQLQPRGDSYANPL